MLKGNLSNLVRNLGLLHNADYARYFFQKLVNYRANQRFKLNFPDLALPPDYLIYESFQLHYQKYYFGGLDTASWLKSLLYKHLQINEVKILDWGCGPGRIIRHLPDLMGSHNQFYGTDVNANSIDWCTNYLPKIKFNNNNIAAKLPYANDFFDVIYGISIFTHLSEQSHFEWFNELNRILKPGGIMLLTTQGNNFESKLTSKELQQFRLNQIVVRGNVREGHRVYSAFHPVGFIQNLFKEYILLEHITRSSGDQAYLPQDVWIIRKRTP